MSQPARSEIPVTLRLSKGAQARLAGRAAAAGVTLSDYLARSIESAVESPRTLAEISGPGSERFLSKGTTDEQLVRAGVVVQVSRPQVKLPRGSR